MYLVGYSNVNKIVQPVFLMEKHDLIESVASGTSILLTRNSDSTYEISVPYDPSMFTSVPVSYIHPEENKIVYYLKDGAHIDDLDDLAKEEYGEYDELTQVRQSVVDNIDKIVGEIM